MALGLPTVGQIGKGTMVSYADVGNTTWTDLAEVVDIKAPRQTADPIEVYRYDSPSLYAELIAGWKKGGEGEITVVYGETQSAAVNALVNLPKQFKITKPGGTHSLIYQGMVIDFGEEYPLKDKMVFSFKFRVTSDPTRV